MSEPVDLAALTSVLDALAHPMAMSGPDAVPIFVNAAFRRYHGVTPEEDLSEAGVRLLHPEDLPRFEQAVQRLLDQPDRAHAVELRLLRDDGEWRWHLAQADPIVLAEGSRYWVVSYVDIEEHRRQEQQLREEKQRADSALALIDAAQERAPVGFAFVDRDLRFQRVNGTLADINGMSVERHLGRRVSEVVPALWPQLSSLYARAMAGETVRGVEIVGETGALPGIRREFLATYFPVQVRADEPVAGVGVIIDEVTEQRHLERQLVLAQKMEAVGLLAGGIAHDFNNVLAVVNLTAQSLLERGTDPQTRDGLERIVAAARSAAQLTRSLLVVARREPVEPRPVDIVAALEDLRGVIDGTLHESVTLDIEVADGTPAVLIDPTAFDQVLLNLVVNARDAMPGGGRLVISSGLLENRPGMVGVTVTDSGVGMSRDVLDQAMTPFFTTKPHGHGTGLGLSTVYGIVTAAGGELVITSRPGLGTSVALALPAAGVAGSGRAQDRAPRPGSAQRLLVVEDEPSLRASIAEVLRMAGYDVRTAAGTDEATALLDDAPDLLLCDVVMPGTSGPELARQVQVRWPTTRILLMSGYSRDIPLAPGEAVRWPLLSKPFTMDTLLEAVADQLADAGRPGG